MNIAERIYETVKTLPEHTAGEVLNFAEGLKAKQVEEEQMRRENALSFWQNIAIVSKLANLIVKSAMTASTQPPKYIR